MPRTIKAVVLGEQQLLKKAGIDTSDAILLLAGLLDAPKEYVFTHQDDELNDQAAALLHGLILKRIEGFSVAALVGFKYFYGLRFEVSTDTLIPRPATETLVQRAIEHISQQRNASVLDIGTGSGNIIIAIARLSHTHATFTASDISSAALAIAERNAEAHDVTIRFIKSNLFSDIPHHPYTLITANLPYLSSKQLQEKTIAKEPVGALFGGERGLSLYTEFFKQVGNFIARNGVILVEIDPSQTDAIEQLAKEYLPNCITRIIQDLEGFDRVVEIVLRS